MATLLPTTELEAINTLLSIIGESPVNSADDNGVVTAVMARQRLTEVSREVQSRGWHWNTDAGYKIALTFPDKEAKVPANTLAVDTVGASLDIDVVMRGVRLYDRRNHTYTFDKPLFVDIVRFLPFEELPEPARQYIMVRAGRIFQDRVVGSGELNGFNVADENRAWTNLRSHECRIADLTLRSTRIVQSVRNRGR